MNNYSHVCLCISSGESLKRIGTVMGSCLGHCRLARDSFSLYKFYSKADDAVDIQINEFVNSASEEHILNISPALQDDEIIENSRFQYDSKKFNFKCLKTIFSNVRKKNENRSALKLELLDDEWSATEGEYSARSESLVIQSSAKIEKEKSHNSVSSLDLEWEHLPEMAVFSTNVVEKEEPQSATSIGGWSRLSSADSLEWDSAEVELKDEIDTETEQLIQEIEMLSLKTLQETQEWTS